MNSQTFEGRAAGVALGVWVWLSVSVAVGQEATGEVLTVEAAVERAVEREGFETAQSAQLEALAGERESAKAWPNPTLAYDREQQWEAGEAIAEDFFILEQALPIWGTRALRAEVVEARRSAAEAANAAERLDRRLEVERAFWETVRERRRLELAERLLDQVESTVEIMEMRREADEASAYAVARLEESLVEAESAVAEARASLVQARGRLAGLIGRSPTPLEAWSVEGEFLAVELPALEGLVDRLQQRPDFAELRAEARAEAKHREALGRSLVPTPAVRGGYKRVDDPTGGSFHGVAVGVSVELPVFDQKSGEREAAAARRTRLRAVAELRRRQAESELRAAHRAAEMRLEAARDYRKRAIPKVEDLLERARNRQEAGEGSLFGLVDAHRAVFETRVQAIERAWEARSAVIDVKAHAGGFR